MVLKNYIAKTLCQTPKRPKDNQSMRILHWLSQFMCMVPIPKTRIILPSLKMNEGQTFY